MTKTIETLVDDIHDFVNGDINSYVGDNLESFEQDIGNLYRARFLPERDRDDDVGSVRMSSLGVKCFRKLWYRQHHRDSAEKLLPSGRLKFFFGDVLESILLRLAEDSGHTVEGKQDELELFGVKGHRDAIIDGVTVDCKSASSYSFAKFKEGLSPDTDVFGYLKQLEAYVAAAQDDELVKDKNGGAFLVFDKQHGHITLDYHTFDIDINRIEEYINSIRKAVNNDEREPGRAYLDVSDGKSGNRKLDTECSYCEFKRVCWPELRTFIYSTGPRFLTKVVREPDVFEVKE